MKQGKSQLRMTTRDGLVVEELHGKSAGDAESYVRDKQRTIDPRLILEQLNPGIGKVKIYV